MLYNIECSKNLRDFSVNILFTIYIFIETTEKNFIETFVETYYKNIQ